MTKMGRPSVEEPKSKRVSMRVTEKEYQQIMEYAKLKDMTVAELIKISLYKYMEEEK